MTEIRRSRLRPPTRLVLIRINYNWRRDITGYIVEGKGRSTTEDRIISQAHGGRLIRRKGGRAGAEGRRRPLFSPRAREKQVGAGFCKQIKACLSAGLACVKQQERALIMATANPRGQKKYGENHCTSNEEYYSAKNRRTYSKKFENPCTRRAENTYTV